VPTDADKLLSVMTKIGSETPYLVMDERGMAMTTTELAENLATLYESPNNVLLVALAGEAIIGTASVSASSKKRLEHIGEIALCILKEYWGYGLGSLPMDDLIRRSPESHVIGRLVLMVLDRNQPAI
ncbi:GNAT family N-acetyltransferase, partial [Enterococcus faecalis]|uniref:GNAT family N-acetyltransferase n=1 Tax=Enterococcus faecalis TaxID=1351 RepID=UPI0021E08E1B